MNPLLIIFALSLAIPCNASTSQTDIFRLVTPFSKELLLKWIDNQGELIKRQKNNTQREAIERELQKLRTDFKINSLEHGWTTMEPYSEMDRQEFREEFLNLWDELVGSNNVKDLSAVICKYECARKNFEALNFYQEPTARIRAQRPQTSAALNSADGA